MTKIDHRTRAEIWTDIGFRDGYDSRWHPPKHGNVEAYITGWGEGTIAQIKDAQEKQEKSK